MTRNPAHVHKSGVQSSENPFRFIMSTASTDRVGDVIRQDGWDLKNFKQNPIALFGHDHSFPIGSWKNVAVREGQLQGTLVLADKGTSARVDEIRALIEQRILKAVSVGFSIKQYEPMDKGDPWGAWDIQKQELLETSVVSVPANQDAVALAKSLGISKATERLIFGAGQSSTLNTQSQAKSATVTSADYTDLLGEPSKVVRLRKRGLIE